mmetsp:Transcript_3118/g.3460  ORF Transcript_3118/g.3460 Transcript_3118/m.3460 type:complete len:234 (+) Transcript_3118:528-1229(+)
MNERTLTPSETKEIKKQRRKVKNREYASRSRQVKKKELELTLTRNKVLESQNQDLQARVTALQERVKVLEKENAELKAQQNHVDTENFFADVMNFSAVTKTATVTAFCLVFMVFFLSFNPSFYANLSPVSVGFGAASLSSPVGVSQAVIKEPTNMNIKASTKVSGWSTRRRMLESGYCDGGEYDNIAEATLSSPKSLESISEELISTTPEPLTKNATRDDVESLTASPAKLVR